MPPISVVINTWNSAATLRTTLESVRDLGEIVIMDMHSSDDTREIAKEFTPHIHLHPHTGYVEPARNAAIAKATGEWILVLDSDEEVPPSLAAELRLIAAQPKPKATHYFIPRKNLIFGQWVQHAGWWPDNQLRFFKSGAVIWQDQIHSVPKTTGETHTFPSEETYALIHHNYTSISQWVQRMDRYTDIQAKELVAGGYQYSFADNLSKPFNEFLRRFFAWEGYKDGVIGLNLSLLQSLSELVVYLKVRELQKTKDPTSSEFRQQLQNFTKSSNKELSYWLVKSGIKSKVASLLEKLQ